MASAGRGITNKQAKYLAALQRELAIKVNIAGLTRQQAHLEIEKLKLKIEARDRAAQSRPIERAPRKQYPTADGSAG